MKTSTATAPTFPRLHSRMLTRGVAASAVLAMTALTHANEVVFDCTVVQKTSTATQSTDLSAPFAGTLIGDYVDPTNLAGTRTIPGYFGGSGNNAIPYTASFVVAGDIASHPTGALTLGVDSEGLQIRVSDLALDMLGGTTGAMPATLNINYQTFRTVAPSSLYPGGVTIPIPVGDATVTTFEAVQVGASVVGVLLPQKNGTLQFNIAVPVNYMIVAAVMDQPVSDGTPVPGVLTLSGTLTEGTNAVTLAIEISNSENSTQPVEAEPFVDVPMAMPTVIPTGGTANLLISGDVTSLTVAQSLVASIDIAGTRQPIPGDLNGDWIVNAADLSIVLANWGTSGPGDINGDGIVSAADMSLVLAFWS